MLYSKLQDNIKIYIFFMWTQVYAGATERWFTPILQLQLGII